MQQVVQPQPQFQLVAVRQPVQTQTQLVATAPQTQLVATAPQTQLVATAPQTQLVATQAPQAGTIILGNGATTGAATTTLIGGGGAQTAGGAQTVAVDLGNGQIANVDLNTLAALQAAQG